MVSASVVRLQNLPWSASAPDVREFFAGFEIPNGGVRIIGGDDGDCFVSFSTGRDAHDALRKDRSYLKGQQIRLQASSEEEMQYIIAVAKGETPPKPTVVYARNESPTPNYGRKRQLSPEAEARVYRHDNRTNNGDKRARETQNPAGWQENRFAIERQNVYRDGRADMNYDDSSQLPSSDIRNDYHSGIRQGDSPRYGKSGNDPNELPVPNSVNRNDRSGVASNSSEYSSISVPGNSGRYDNVSQDSSYGRNEKRDDKFHVGFSRGESNDRYSRQMNKDNYRKDLPDKCEYSRDGHNAFQGESQSMRNFPQLDVAGGNKTGNHSNVNYGPDSSIRGQHDSGVGNERRGMSTPTNQLDRRFSDDFGANKSVGGPETHGGYSLPSSNSNSFSNRTHDLDNTHNRVDNERRGSSSTNDNSTPQSNQSQRYGVQLPHDVSRTDAKHFQEAHFNRPSVNEESHFDRTRTAPSQGSSWSRTSSQILPGSQNMGLRPGFNNLPPNHNNPMNQVPANQQFPPNLQSPPNQNFQPTSGVPQKLNDSQNINMPPNSRGTPNVNIPPNVRMPLLLNSNMSSGQNVQSAVGLPLNRGVLPGQFMSSNQGMLPNQGLMPNQLFPSNQRMPLNSGGLHNPNTTIGAMAPNLNMQPALVQKDSPLEDRGFSDRGLPLNRSQTNVQPKPSSAGRSDFNTFRRNEPPPKPQSRQEQFSGHDVQVPFGQDKGGFHDSGKIPNQRRSDIQDSCNRGQQSLTVNQRPPFTLGNSDQQRQPPHGTAHDTPHGTTPAHRGDYSGLSRSATDHDFRVDSDLRSTQGRPAASSKSVPLLPTPNIPPSVPSLLDVNISHRPPSQTVDITEPPAPQSNNQDSKWIQTTKSEVPFRPDSDTAKVENTRKPLGSADKPDLLPGASTSVIPISEPYAYFSNLPRDVHFKQLRGLFATHNIIAKNIALRGPLKSGETADAVVLFDSIDATLTTLNELTGFKLSGRVIKITPCQASKYHQFLDDPDLKGGHLSRPPRFESKHDSDNSGRHWRGHGRNDRVQRSPDYSRMRRDSRSPRRNRRQHRSRSPRRSRTPSREKRFEPKASPPHATPGSQSSSRPARIDKDDYRNMPASKGEPRSSHKSKDSRAPESGTVSEKSWCAILTGLPPKARRAHVEQFLTDIQYDSNSLYLEFNVHKECTGTAYVEIATEHHLNMLMNSPKELLEHTVHVTATTKEQMNSQIDEHKKNLASDKTKPGEFVLQLMGLPVDATPRTVSEFLYPTSLKESEISIVKSSDGSGRCIGTGFARVHSLEDREAALKHDRGYIGKRYVTIRVVSEQVMNDLLNKPDIKSIKKAESQPGTDNKGSCLVRMVNLRYEIKPEQVESFFRGYNPESGSVNFTMQNGMPTGKGTVRMKTPADAAKAVEELNQKEFSGRPLLLSLHRT